MGVRSNKGRPLDIVLPGVIPFAEGTTLPAFDLPNTYLYEGVQLQLAGTVTHTGYTAAPTIRTEGPENLISSLQITGNQLGNGAQAASLSNVDFAFLRMKDRIFAGTDVDRVAPTNANGAQNFYTTVEKHFGVRGVPALQDATFLDGRLYSKLQLSLNTRTIAALVKPGSGTAGNSALSNCQLTVHARVWEGAANVASAPYVRETMQEMPITSSLPALDAVPQRGNLPVGQAIVRLIFKGCVGDTDYAEPSDAFFTTNLRSEGAHLKVEVTGNKATKTVLDNTYDHIQASNKKRFRLEQWPVGYAVWDASRDGSPENILGMNGVITGQTRGDFTPVNGQTNTLWLHVEELVKG